MTINEELVNTLHGEIITLEEAIDRFEVSSIIKRFGTWAVTTYGVECLATSYFFEFDRVDEIDWVSHMKYKTWVNLNDFQNALIFARGIYRRRENFLKRGKSLKAFLCHAKEDKLAIRNIYNQLMTRGIQPWFDEKDILPGQDWAFEIKKAVKSSDVVIVFLSKESVDKTGFVQKEIKIALDAADERPEGKIFLIPARLEECTVPDRLRDRQWVDLFTDEGFDQLVQSLIVCARE